MAAPHLLTVARDQRPRCETHSGVLATLALLCVLFWAGVTRADAGMPIRGDRLSGFVLPIEPLDGPIEIRALRAHAWTIDDTQRLLLDQDVEIRLAGHTFRAADAAVWINRIPSERGVINQVALYFDQVSNPTRRAGMGVAGRDLLVTGSTRGQVVLEVSLVEPARPPRRGLLERGERRLAAHLRQIAADPPELRRRPTAFAPPEPPPFRPEPGRHFEPEAILALPERIDLPEPEEPAPWLVPPTGSLRYAAASIDVETGEDENTITLIGPIVVEYLAGDLGERWQRISITADRGVIFTDPGPLEDFATGRLDATAVRGVYLEGSVIIRADDDEYTLRAPGVYYDFRSAQAIMVDAVLRTYTRDGEFLIYTRAREMRQIAENQWEAQHVVVSTSEFFTPHLAVGARRAIVTQRPAREDAAERETHLDVRGLTLRAGDVPFFYWPRFAGTLRDMPLRRIALGSRDSDGFRIETTWNLFTLMGIEPPPGWDGDLKLDGFTKRGVGTGVELRYDVGGSEGTIDLYGLYDDGIDKTSTGRRVDPDRDFRGVALWEHQMQLGRNWTFQGQASYISDPTFVSAWREEDFRTRREYETSAYLKHQVDNAAFTILAKHELNDFISNDYLLASQQYQVDRLPEMTYRRYGDSLFGDRFTYSSESRVTRMRLVFNETTPAEIGVPPVAFGIGLHDPIDEMLFAQGLRTSYVLRGDTRHELSMPVDWGIFRMVPFLVGRVTAYDRDFEEFSSDADKLRFYGAAGLTVMTQFQRVNNAVQSRIFDLNRLRHIVEPSVTVWYGYADVAGENFPIYDPEVEALADGAAFRFGLRNTWQTQRGGPGRWRSVDFLTVDTNLVLHSGDATRRSPSPQFFEFRPEYSQPGDHVNVQALWLLSDSLSVAGSAIYDLDESHIARGSIGTELRHTPALSTFVEYRFLEASDSRLLDAGLMYRLSPKYAVRLTPQWDFREDDLRAINVRVVRNFPDFELIVFFRYDKIQDDTRVGATLGMVRF